MAAVMDKRIYKTAARVVEAVVKAGQTKLMLVSWNQHEVHSLLSSDRWQVQDSFRCLPCE
jgi:hypothetical protein